MNEKSFSVHVCPFVEMLWVFSGLTCSTLSFIRALCSLSRPGTRCIRCLHVRSFGHSVIFDVDDLPKIHVGLKFLPTTPNPHLIQSPELVLKISRKQYRNYQHQSNARMNGNEKKFEGRENPSTIDGNYCVMPGAVGHDFNLFLPLLFVGTNKTEWRKTSGALGRRRLGPHAHCPNNEPKFVKWKWCSLGDDSIPIRSFFHLCVPVRWPKHSTKAHSPA